MMLTSPANQRFTIHPYVSKPLLHYWKFLMFFPLNF